jgi:hypothetical protein
MKQAVEAHDTLARLRDLLAREGEALAPALAAPGSRTVMAPLALACAAGNPPAGARAGELALVLESILEGYLLHYGRPRLLDTADEDLRLLAGDHLYAVGLSRLARLGDLDAVRALADLITLCARVHADADANGATAQRPAALWLLTTLAVGGGRWPGYERSLEAARSGRDATDEMLAEGHRRAVDLGVELEAQAALIAFGSAVADRPHA